MHHHNRPHYVRAAAPYVPPEEYSEVASRTVLRILARLFVVLSIVVLIGLFVVTMVQIGQTNHPAPAIPSTYRAPA